MIVCLYGCLCSCGFCLPVRLFISLSLVRKRNRTKEKGPTGHSHPYPSTVETGLRNSLRSNSPRLIPSLVAAVLNGLFIKWRKKTHPRPLHKGGELSSRQNDSDEGSCYCLQEKRFFLPLVVRMTGLWRRDFSHTFEMTEHLEFLDILGNIAIK